MSRGQTMYRLKLDNLPTSDYFGRVKQYPGRWTHGGICQNAVDILVVMLDGECEFAFSETGEVRRLKAGEATLIRRGSYYRGSCREECEYYFFHIPALSEPVGDDEVRASLDAARQERESAPVNCYIREPTCYGCLFIDVITDIRPVMKSVVSLLSKCDVEMAKSDVNRKLRCDMNLLSILGLISEQALHGFTNQTAYPAALDRILGYVYEHYTEPLTLESLSERFGLSKQYIIRLFRTHLGTTVTHFINDLKLSHAPELLTSSTLNISEITAYLGFSSPSYFSRLFRAKYGVSPTRFI